MNKLNKQEINILKIIFEYRDAFFVRFANSNPCAFGALASSFFLSVSTLNKLAQSKYFQNKITQVFEENDISSNGIISITFNNFSSADITLE